MSKTEAAFIEIATHLSHSAIGDPSPFGNEGEMYPIQFTKSMDKAGPQM